MYVPPRLRFRHDQKFSIPFVDEATGYQEVRKKRALQIKFQTFIAEELQEWAQMFKPEFWIELARLEGIRYSPPQSSPALGQVHHGFRLRRHRHGCVAGIEGRDTGPSLPEQSASTSD